LTPFLLLGATFAFSAAVQPGPFQAYLVSSTMAGGWRRTTPAAFAPLLSDIPIVALVLLLLTRIPPLWLDVLRVGGGLFLLYLAVRAWRAFRHYKHELAGTAFDFARAGEACPTAPAAVPAKLQRRTLLEAVTVNLLNPNPYISWSTVLGPLAIQAWREAPSHAAALVCAFYVTMVAATIALVLLLAGARSLGPRIGRALVAFSAVALACFGAYQLWTGGVSILR
jgi:threonine/homoserine/homoserine lactone efflux protein